MFNDLMWLKIVTSLSYNHQETTPFDKENFCVYFSLENTENSLILLIYIASDITWNVCALYDKVTVNKSGEILAFTLRTLQTPPSSELLGSRCRLVHQSNK